MSLQVTRLELATLRGIDGTRWPVHGFLVTYPGGAALVDTGVGGPQDWLDDWRVVNRSVADALDDHGLTPGDIGLVINTHLHFDHCGQNAVFKHAAFHVQRTGAAWKSTTFCPLIGARREVHVDDQSPGSFDPSKRVGDRSRLIGLRRRRRAISRGGTGHQRSHADIRIRLRLGQRRS